MTRSDQIDTAQEVYEQLSRDQPRIASRFFYDREGDVLFQRITKMPGYYLTRCEMEILRKYSGELAEITATSGELHIVELGAGDGSKTELILDAMLEQGVELTYSPIDVSENALKTLGETLKGKNVRLNPVNATYEEGIRQIGAASEIPRLLLFLGSNLGNMELEQSGRFMAELSESMQPGDHLLLGVDLKKDKKLIYSAYSDRQGITAAFNMNLLRRFNREFLCDFDLKKFRHLATYDENSGAARSYLQSTATQIVHFGILNSELHFQKDQLIATEISQKYDDESMDGIIKGSGLEKRHFWEDSLGYFRDYLFVRT